MQSVFTPEEMKLVARTGNVVSAQSADVRRKLAERLEAVLFGIELAVSCGVTAPTMSVDGLMLAAQMDTVTGRTETTQTAVGRVVEALID